MTRLPAWTSGHRVAGALPEVGRAGACACVCASTCQCMCLCVHVCVCVCTCVACLPKVTRQQKSRAQRLRDERGSGRETTAGEGGAAGGDRSRRARRPGRSPEEPRVGRGGRGPGRAQAGSRQGPSALAPGLAHTPPLGHTQCPDLPWALSLPARGAGLGQVAGADPGAGGRAVTGHFSPAFSHLSPPTPKPQAAGLVTGPLPPAWVAAAFLGYGPSRAPRDSTN